MTMTTPSTIATVLKKGIGGLLLGSILILCLSSLPSFAQKRIQGDHAIPEGIIHMDLWDKVVPPHDNGVDYSDLTLEDKRQYAPQIHVALPAKKGDTPTKAVVICPGGGYALLSPFHEGYGWSGLFTREGIAAIMVTYRMPYGIKEIPMEDVLRAIELVREHASEWNIDPSQIGIMGFSAGGHLASSVATMAPPELRPSFQILFYPVISSDPRWMHKGSFNNLLGEMASSSQREEYSTDRRVDSLTPPAILLLSDDDRGVPPMNSILYYSALKANGIPASLHIYPSGGHGWGDRMSFPYHEQMTAELTAWLRRL